MKRIGVVGIIVTNRESVGELQSILSDYSDIIIGRMGVPIHEKQVNAISLIVCGENEKVSALTGKIGRMPDINVKSALNSITLDN